MTKVRRLLQAKRFLLNSYFCLPGAPRPSPEPVLYMVGPHHTFKLRDVVPVATCHQLHRLHAGAVRTHSRICGSSSGCEAVCCRIPAACLFPTRALSLG